MLQHFGELEQLIPRAEITELTSRGVLPAVQDQKENEDEFNKLPEEAKAAFEAMGGSRGRCDVWSATMQV